MKASGGLRVGVHPAAGEANAAAADCLAGWLADPGTRNVMLAAGNTPLELYRRIGERRLDLSRLNLFVLDEYVGVPLDEPRRCANLLRRCAAEVWGVPPERFFAVSSLEEDALESVRRQERRIEEAGGLDVIVLGLGENGHLAFNEPGSSEGCAARVLDLEPVSIEANRKWFGGGLAPARGATVGMKTILAARRILILAYGLHKAAAVRAMLEGPRGEACPASFLQGHSCVRVFLDAAAASASRTPSLEPMSAPGAARAAAPFTAIGIDIGGTKTAAGIVEFPGGRVRGRRQVPTRPERGGEAVLGDVSRLAEELLREAAGEGLRVEALGLGVCELVDRRGRVMSGNCLAWEGIDLEARLSRLVPAVVEADVRAAALAEAVAGAGRGYRFFIYVTVGTGISSCLVIDGKPFTGARGATGTLASSPASAECERCGHVSRRSLEETASGPALVARYAERRPGMAATGREVLAAAATDEAARSVARAAGEALGVAVGLLVNVLDPEAVIVGGGLGLSEGHYWDAFAASARRHIWSDAHRDLPILRAATGEDAGLIGAAAAARERFSSGAPAGNAGRPGVAETP